MVHAFSYVTQTGKQSDGPPNGSTSIHTEYKYERGMIRFLKT